MHETEPSPGLPPEALAFFRDNGRIGGSKSTPAKRKACLRSLKKARAARAEKIASRAAQKPDDA